MSDRREQEVDELTDHPLEDLREYTSAAVRMLSSNGFPISGGA